MARSCSTWGRRWDSFLLQRNRSDYWTANRWLFAGRIRGQATAKRDGSEGRLVFPALLGSSCSARFSQPSSVIFMPGVRIPCSPAHRSATAWVGRSGGVHDRRCFCFQSGSKDAIAGCNPKKAVEIEHGFLRDVMVGRMALVARFAVRHNNVESVGGSALERSRPDASGEPPGSAAPKAARVRKLGSAVVPTTASAPLRRKMRRVDGHKTLLLAVSSWFLANG